MFDGQSTTSTRYEPHIAERVRALQDHYGLQADGLIGAETMALLMALQQAGPSSDDRRRERFRFCHATVKLHPCP